MYKLPRLVGITGKARSGKDTAANFLCTRHGYTKYSLAAPIKRGIEAMFNLTSAIWNDPAKETPLDVACMASPRQLAQTLGTEWGRDTISENIWINLMERHWNYMNEFAEYSMVVPDIRFDNEADWITNNGGVVVRIDRAVTGVRSHVSEAGIDEACIDFVINNDTDMITDMLRDFREGLENFADAAIGLKTKCYN